MTKSNRSRGADRLLQRAAEPWVVNSRGQFVSSLETTQTYLTDSETDELDAAYEADAMMVGLA